jgi:hypothetical protein
MTLEILIEIWNSLDGPAQIVVVLIGLVLLVGIVEGC